MRHDPVRLAYKCREQASQSADGQTAAILRGIAGDLEELAGLLAFLRRPIARDDFGADRRVPRRSSLP